jgi:multicomponent Na+:H+ antiporter subunit C
MTVDITLIVLMAAFFAAGIYLLLERSLTRVLLGLILVGNGANILLLAVSGGGGKSPLYVAGTAAEDYTDPLPQALILTAIVITFAVTAFMLGIIYRSWVLGREDAVQDDPEDRRVADQGSFDYEDDADIAADTSEFSDAAPEGPVRRSDGDRAAGPAGGAR